MSDPTLDGPYCGAFFCTDPENPFVGLVFKVSTSGVVRTSLLFMYLV